MFGNVALFVTVPLAIHAVAVVYDEARERDG